MDIETDTGALMEIREDYTLKRLVYVNSANHGYSELLLDHHLAMFGRNNVGKTASLAGTKLLLFPETNFRKCEEKFGFKGKDGAYSMEESYDFYFPDARSFLILEEENPEGTFCMVLYRMNNYAYGRYFIPLPYAEIRHLFWDTQAEDFAHDLSTKTVSRFMKANKGIQLSDKKEIAALMYASYREAKERKRFCVLPLKDDRGDCIQAFKSIYQLAFETSHNDTDSLPKAIASLLEMNRATPRERLDANLKQLTDEHNELVEKQQRLILLKNQKPAFTGVEQEFNSITEKVAQYSQMHQALTTKLTEAKSNYAPRNARVEQQFNSVTQQKNTANAKVDQLTKEVREAETLFKKNQQDFERREKEIGETKALISTYGGKSEREIIGILEEELDRLRGALGTYHSEKGVEQALQKNIEDQNRNNRQIAKFKNLIKQEQALLPAQLNEAKAVRTLVSLNDKFAELSVELSSQQRGNIRAFTELFDTDGAGYLSFLGNSMDVLSTPYDHERKIQDWKKRLDDIEGEQQKLKRQIDEQSHALQNQNISKLITDTEKELKDAQIECDLIKALGKSETDNIALRFKISQDKIDLETKKVALESSRNDFSALTGKWQTLYNERTELSQALNQYERVELMLRTAQQAFTPSHVAELSLHEVDFEDACLESLSTQAQACQRMFSRFGNTLNQLISQIPLEGIDSHQQERPLEECADIVRQYSSRYQMLEFDEQQYRNEIRQHNQVVNGQLAELTNAKNELLTFTRDINQDLNKSAVSNLSEIKLHLTLNPGFMNLLDTLDKHDIQDDTLLDAQFYASLSAFVESYFNKKTRRLKLHDIIESITYQYRLADSGELVTKSQSGGTSSTITAFVLSVLLKRLSPRYVSLSIPIIVDEISTLDANNTDATIQQIAAHGFSIFCATPSFSAAIIQKVHRFLSIDRHHVANPQVDKCLLNILPEHVEEFGVVTHEA